MLLLFQYMEKLAAGGCIFRSYSAEEKYKQSYQQIQQDRMEKLYQLMEGQFEKESREGISLLYSMLKDVLLHTKPHFFNHFFHCFFVL